MRTVTKVTTNTHGPAIIEFSDGSTETLQQGQSVPNVGDMELTDGYGNRLGWSSGQLTVGHAHSLPYSPVVSSTDINWNIYSPDPEIAECSKCGQVNEISESYNWCDDDRFERKICRKCHTEIMDKLFGLSRNIKSEEVLFGKK